MLRKIQAVIAILSTLIVFVIFAFLQAPVNQAAVPTSVTLVGNQNWPAKDTTWPNALFINSSNELGAHVSFGRPFKKYNLSTGAYISSAPAGDNCIVYDYALMSNGNIVAAASGNDGCQSIKIYSSAGNLLSSFGSFGSGNGQFGFLISVAVDSANNIYTLELGTNSGVSRVQKFNSTGTYITSFGSRNNLCGNSQFWNPTSVWVDSADSVYVADAGCNRVQKFNSSGTYLLQFGSLGSGPGQFDNPRTIVSNANGTRLMIYDRNNDRVQEYTTAGSFYASYPLTGTPPATYDFGFNNFVVSPAGEFIFADFDNNRILKYSSSGAYASTISYQTSDDGNIISPNGIAADSAGNIYVAEINGHRVEKFSSAGTFVSRLGNVSDPEFQAAWDLDLDADGNIYVLDSSNDRIQVYDPSYTPITQFSGSGESAIVDGIAVAVADDKVYVIDRSDSSVKIFTLGGSFLSKFTSGDIVSPVGIDVGPNGDIYVAVYGDLYDNSSEDEGVLVFSPTGEFKRRVGFDSNLNFPGGVAVDEYGYTYITECSGDKVAVFDDIGTYITFFGYSGTAAGQLDCPTGIEIGPEREMIISDQGNNRVQVFRASIPTVTHTPTPTPTPTPATWVNVGTPINPGGYTGSVFVRTDKVNQDPIVAYPEYSESESNYKVTVRRYNKSTGNWELVGNSRFSNPLTSSGQGRFSFDTCEDGRMVALIADASENDKATLYRYENGTWGVLGVAGATPNNAAYGLGMFCQPIAQLPYLYAFPNPDGVGDDLTYGYNFNPDLGGWVTIQEIPCTTSSGLTLLNPNLLIGDPVNNFTWFVCSNGSVSEFTGTLWNNPVSALFTSPTTVQDFAYHQGESKWVFATEDVVNNTFRVYSSTGGTNKTQLGGSFDFPSEYDSMTFPASLVYNQTVDAMWYAVPTGNTTFVVKEFNGSTWGNVLNEFTETGLHADDVDLYHDPTCNGANYLALAIQTGAGQSSIVVKRDSSYIPCGELPTVTTGQVTSVTQNSAVVGGEVVSDGYLPITDRGIVYSTTNSTPTLGDTIQSTSGTVGVMSIAISDLQVNTLYYVRAFATNSLGTSYGSVVQFTTSTQPTSTPTTTGTSTPAPTGGTATPTSTPTSSANPTALPTITVSSTPQSTITSRREAQQSPVCPIISSFTSSPTIATEGERVVLSWVTKNTTKVTINGSLVAISGSTPLIVPADRKAKLIADNGACIASEVVNFENPAQQQLQTATAVGASALVAEILLQQAISFGTATIGSSRAMMTTNLWGVALSIFNKRKKRQAWGIVYDSKTKNPLGRVVIRLLNVDTEAVVDTVVSDAQGVFQLKTQPGRYLIRVVRAGYQFPSTYVKGDTDGGYTHLYFGGVLTQGAADQQVTVSIPLDPEKETQAKRRTRVLFDAGFEALSTASTITLFAGFGYSLYVATLFPLPINIFASVLYGSVCIGKLLLTLWTPRTFGKVSTVTGKPLAGVEVGIFDKEFNTLLYRTFTNEKGEYNFAVPNKSYVLRLMDNTYKVYSGNNTQGIEIPAIKRKSPSEVRLIAHDLVVNLANNAAP